jgi:FkbM family methyltransferase
MMDLTKINKYFYPYRILDIGANTGQFHILAKETFPNSFIYSIEASDECEEYLKKITNNYYIGLLSKDNEIYDFFQTKLNPINTGNSTYRELTDYYSDENLYVTKKRGVMLDELFVGYDTDFDLIKIDTQGSELDIISGGVNLCRKAKGMVLEVSILRYNIGSPLYDEVILFMNNLGFEKCEVISETHMPNFVHQQDLLFINKNIR